MPLKMRKSNFQIKNSIFFSVEWNISNWLVRIVEPKEKWQAKRVFQSEFHYSLYIIKIVFVTPKFNPPKCGNSNSTKISMTKQTEKPKQVFCAIIVFFVFVFYFFIYNFFIFCNICCFLFVCGLISSASLLQLK